MNDRSLVETTEIVLDLLGQDPLGELRRQAFVELDEGDRRTLRRVHEHLAPHFGRLADAILDRAAALPEFAPYVASAGARHELRASLVLELSDLTGGDWDAAWMAERARIGVLLSDAGLPADWLVAGFSTLLTRAVPLLWALPALPTQSTQPGPEAPAAGTANGPEPPAAVRAFIRVSQLELGILLHARSHLDRTAMAGTRAFARTLLEGVPDAIVLCTPQGRIVEFNSAAERIFELGRDQAIGRSLSELLHEADRPEIERQRGALFDEPSPSSMPSGPPRQKAQSAMTGLRGDGRTVPLEVSMEAGTFDGETIGCVSLRDISDRVLVEQALRRSEANFRALIEFAPDAVLVHRGGALIYANPSALALLGLPSLRAIAGRRVEELLPTLPTGGALEVPGRPQEVQFLRPGTPDEPPTEITIDLRAYALDFDGRPSVVLMARDVTDRHRLAERMLELDRAIAVGSLAGAASHEINNPLTYVLGNTHFARAEARRMAQRLRDPVGHLDPVELAARLDEMARALEEAEEGAIRVRESVASLRSLARRDEAQDVPVGLDTVIDEAVTIVWNQIRHRARLERQYLAVPPVAASRRRLTQVMVHLLLNAAQSIPEGDSAANEIRISTYSAEGSVFVEIGDTGCGMTESQLARAFEPFYTTRPAGEAVGLGLTISRQIVEAASGRLTLESEPGFGTTARLLLPAAEAAPHAPRHSGPLGVAADPCRILLIDDEPNIASAFRRVVDAGHAITSLTSARDALHRLERGEIFDFIFCDLHMPDMTGMALFEVMRVRWPELAARTIFLTGGAFTAEARDFLRRVPNPCLDKPFDAARIGRILASRPRLAPRSAPAQGGSAPREAASG